MSRSADRTATSSGIHHPLLGTNVEVQVAARGSDAQAVADRGHDAAVARMRALEGVFTVFDAGSELRRWREGRHDDVGPELGFVLAEAARWWSLSGGAFHPAAGGLRGRWLRAVAGGVVPTRDETAALAHEVRSLPYQVDAGRVVRVGDCSGVDLNAIAKGFIVDEGVAAAVGVGGRGGEVVDVLVNAGGDLRHTGERVLRVAVEDPYAVGGRPLDVLALAEGALATSGPTHRGFAVGDRWFGHVLDPRTGWPVAGRGSTTVRAPSALVADAVATAAGVLSVDEAAAVVVEEAEVGVLAVLHDDERDGGRIVRFGTW